MNLVNEVARAGGLFSVFAFVHFFVDWIFQSHSEAMVKHNNALIRAKHCAIYTLGFVPLMWMLGFSFWQWFFGLNILFWSHFVEDTYLPVYLWAKYIRKPPQMTMERQGEPYLFIDNDNHRDLFQTPTFIYPKLPADPKKGFVEFVETPLGKILMIAIDQIIHLSFLFPLVWMACCNK